MTVEYAEKIDVLYIRLDATPQQVTNQELDGVILDIGANDRIVGIEILDAAKRLKLDQFLTLEYRKSA
jgi:uncharacterized protein YuzE